MGSVVISGWGVSSAVGPDVASRAAPALLSFDSATQPSMLIRCGSMMWLAVSETLEENSESGNEMSVSVEPSLGERAMGGAPSPSPSENK